MAGEDKFNLFTAALAYISGQGSEAGVWIDGALGKELGKCERIVLGRVGDLVLRNFGTELVYWIGEYVLKVCDSGIHSIQ